MTLNISNSFNPKIVLIFIHIIATKLSSISIKLSDNCVSVTCFIPKKDITLELAKYSNINLMIRDVYIMLRQPFSFSILKIVVIEDIQNNDRDFLISLNEKWAQGFYLFVSFYLLIQRNCWNVCFSKRWMKIMTFFKTCFPCIVVCGS